MEISDLVWRLFLLLLPGIVATLIIRYVTTTKEFSSFYFIIYSAVLGIANLLILEFAISIINIIHCSISKSYFIEFGLNLKIWNCIVNTQTSIPFSELAFSYLISLPFGLFVGWVIYRKLVFRFLRFVSFSNRSGDDDVWSYLLTSNEIDWVYVRDRITGLTYFGQVVSYSDGKEGREILLRDVHVHYTRTGKKLYELKAIYLEYDKSEYTIEIPKS